MERHTQYSRVYHNALHEQFESASPPDLDGLDQALRDAIEGR